MINQHKKLIDLKSQLEPIINIPASHQRMLSCLMSAGSIVSTREYFGVLLSLLSLLSLLFWSVVVVVSGQ